MNEAPRTLRVEHLGAFELGLHVVRPRLSWTLSPGSAPPRWTEIELDDGRTARLDSADSVLVPWPFADLRSREVVNWRVRVGTDDEVSPWSEHAHIEIGLIERDDWTARWIEPVEDELPPSGERPAHVLRHAFDVGAEVGAARLHATAHGIYEGFLNGRRVGDRELTPGFTSYPKTLQVQTYDVTDFLVPGANEWTVVLSDGWYRGRHGIDQRAENYGTTVAFLGQLEITTDPGDHADVDRRTFATGPEWTSATSRIVAADLMAGQAEDHRHIPGDWRPVRVVDHTFASLTSSPAPPVRRIEELPAASITRLASGRQVVDLGQNITGWMRLSTLGPPGSEIALTHGEALDAHGDVTMESLEMGDRRFAQVDRVISAGGGDSFEPRHTIHGFQYAGIDGAPPLTVNDATGVVVHTDLRRTGWFRCSDDRVNRFHEIADWSFRDNACDIPTDCPHRERQGWTGDWALFVATAAYLYDVAGFSTKWLRSLSDEQLPDGLTPNYVPDPRRWKGVADGDPTWFGMQGSSGWGDATVLVPWEIYRSYGDIDILRDTWSAIGGWIGYASNAARTKRHPARAQARPIPAPHEEFLWDGGWHWGEWCEIADPDDEPFYLADQGHVGTAYLHRSASIAAEIARLLGHDRDAVELDALADRALDAWRQEYLMADGTIVPPTQANHVRALAFGLVPDELRAATATRLVELIRNADTHLTTGFLSTPLLLPVLADHGHLDVAFDLLLQDTEPSWLTMVERGASTVWEGWNGIDAEGRVHDSLNHYSKGAMITFLHRYVAGIRPGRRTGTDVGIEPDEVGYRRFTIAPHPGGGITWAEGALDSPYGRIESSWRLTDDTFELEVTVPPGTTADVVLPDGSRHMTGPGTSSYRVVE